jgi:hypothetical protein
MGTGDRRIVIILILNYRQAIDELKEWFKITEVEIQDARDNDDQKQE